MKAIKALIAVFSILPVLAVASPALADSPGQLEGGSIVYVVKNVTQNGSYAPATSANACDEVGYSIRLHNISFGGLTNVNVKVGLPSSSSTSNTSTMTATTNLGGTTGASSTATVNISSAQSISYENGTTVLYNGNGQVIKTLPDTITTTGVDVGGLNGSTTEFVNFKAKVSCPAPAPQVSFACVELDVANVDRTHFDFTAKASAQNATVQSYGFTTKDSNGTTVNSTTLSSSALTSPVYHFNQTNAGTYTVSAVVNTDHGSTAVTSACTKQVTVAAAPQVQSTTTTTPTVLPNTGAGDVLGLFAGASGLGAAGHFVTRRFRR